MGWLDTNAKLEEQLKKAGDSRPFFILALLVVRPNLEAVNGIANVHRQVDGADRLISMGVVQADCRW
jgi:hypothetical protein